MPVTRRFRLPVFYVRKCFPVALRCMTFPVLVTLNRLAAPRCDFIFGMAAPSPIRRFPLGGPTPERQDVACASAPSAGSASAIGTSAGSTSSGSASSADAAFTTGRFTGARSITMLRPSSFG